MKYLFCVQTIFEMDNPRVYTNYVGIFKKYITSLVNRLPDTEVTVLMGEAAFFCDVDIPGAEVVVVTQSEMLNGGEFKGQDVLRSYYRYCHDRGEIPVYMKYHCELLKSKIKTIPDVIISKDNAPYLKMIFPNALMLYTEVGFISRKPFPQTMYYDMIGLNCGSYLNDNWDGIKDEVSLTEYDKHVISTLKNKITCGLKKVSPYYELMSTLRGTYSSIWLLPLQFSRFSNIDGEIQQDSQLEVILYVLDRLPEDAGLIVTVHPDYNVLTPNVIWYLKKKYRNFIYDESFYCYSSSSQYLMGFVDGIINISSSIGLQAMLWDIPCVQIGEYFAGFASRKFGSPNMLSPLSECEKNNNSKALYWLFTRYVVLPEYYANPEWLEMYFERIIHEKKYPEIDEPKVIFDKLINSISFEGLPATINIGKAERYYNLYTKASSTYFRGTSFSTKLENREVLIYGKSSLAYLLELEIKNNGKLLKNYKGIIDSSTYMDYSFTGNELMVVTPVLDYGSIVTALRKCFCGEIISIEDLLQ